MGDPAGIGAEVIVKALADPVLRHKAHVRHLRDERAARVRGGPRRVRRLLVARPVQRPAAAVPARRRRRRLRPVLDARRTPIRRRAKWAAKRRMRFCLDAIDAARRKLVDAVVTAPIAKESWKLAGYHFPGHTELFAQRTGARRYAMMFAGGPLKVVLATVHVPLNGLWGRLNIGAVFQPIELMHEALVDWFDIPKPAHRRLRRQPARQRERPVRRRGRTHHLPRHPHGPRARHRRHRPLPARHDLPRRRATANSTPSSRCITTRA